MTTFRPSLAGVVVVAAAVVIIASCDIPSAPMPPYRLADPHLNDDASALLMTVVNTADLQIATIHFSCLVTDASASASVPSTGMLEAEIDPGEGSEIEIDLSTVTWHDPVPPRMVDQLHLFRVDYVDGSGWVDHLSMFVFSETIR